MPWHGVGLTDQGLVRFSNQDAFAVVNECNVWIIADGMGGLAGGDIASHMAIDSIVKTIQDKQAPIPEPSSFFNQAIRSANDAIQSYSATHSHLSGMGTTIVVIHISEAPEYQATISHVGDSRAYLIRDQSLTQLTQDHSLVEERIREGLLTKEQAEHHPLRHILTQAVGPDPTVTPDSSTLHLMPGDGILLCTDGLTKMLTDSQILQIVQQTGDSLEAVCRALVDEANRQGGEDNVTVVLIGQKD